MKIYKGIAKKVVTKKKEKNETIKKLANDN